MHKLACQENCSCKPALYKSCCWPKWMRSGGLEFDDIPKTKLDKRHLSLLWKYTGLLNKTSFKQQIWRWNSGTFMQSLQIMQTFGHVNNSEMQKSFQWWNMQHSSGTWFGKKYKQWTANQLSCRKLINSCTRN